MSRLWPSYTASWTSNVRQKARIKSWCPSPSSKCSRSRKMTEHAKEKFGSNFWDQRRMRTPWVTKRDPCLDRTYHSVSSNYRTFHKKWPKTTLWNFVWLSVARTPASSPSSLARTQTNCTRIFYGRTSRRQESRMGTLDDWTSGCSANIVPIGQRYLKIWMITLGSTHATNRISATAAIKPLAIRVISSGIRKHVCEYNL